MTLCPVSSLPVTTGPAAFARWRGAGCSAALDRHPGGVARVGAVVGERPGARERLDQGRLAGAVGPDDGDVLTALEPQLAVVQQHALADADTAPSSNSNTTRPLRSGGLNANAEPLAVALTAVDPVDLVQPLLARLRLARARAGAEARDELLEPVDLRLLALDRAPECEFALRLLGTPLMPGAREELAAPGLELEHARSRPTRGTSDRGRSG